MDIVLGATGNIGSAVVDALLARGRAVTAVIHSADKAAELESRGAATAVVDLHDAEALRPVLRSGERAFLVNPPADPSTDTDAEEHRTVSAIASALEGSGVRRVVMVSAYGARQAERCGDLSVLWDFEQAVKATGIPTLVQRGAYYFTNFDMLLDDIRSRGVLQTMLSADTVLPMVDPADLGAQAARFLESDETGVRFVEGPRRYSIQEVADAFADVLGRDVRVETAPRDTWEEVFAAQGFSPEAARAYANMTEVTDTEPFLPDDPIRGPTTLEDHIRKLVAD